MAIDLNDEVKLWGGFTASEFWLGAAVILVLFLSFAVGISIKLHNFKIGFGLFFGICGPWIMFLLYQRELPKGYLLRRWRQEGRFLFIHVALIKGTDLYSPPADGRGAAWDRDFEVDGAD